MVNQLSGWDITAPELAQWSRAGVRPRTPETASMAAWNRRICSPV